VYPGFRADHLLTARLALSPVKYATTGGAQGFFASLFDNLRREPGVENAAAINAIPFGGHGGDRSFFIEGRPVAPGEPTPDEQVRFAMPRYFAVMQIPVRGREFTERDVDEAVHVAVVNEAFAKKYWPAGKALGHRVQFQPDTMNRYEIVGVAGNVRHRALDAEEKPELYVPVFQPLFAGFRMPAMDVVVRTAGDPAPFAMTLRRVVSQIDPDQPIADVRTMDEWIGRSVASRRFTTLLLTLFSGLAVVLAGIGMSGLVAYAVVQRTHEIGVRLALGAQPHQVVALMLGQGLQPALIGTAMGVAAAAAAARMIRGLLFGVESTDVTTFVAVATLLLAISAVACWLPARRASSVDPILALRTE
jgi:putative ABC transport system permease protein